MMARTVKTWRPFDAGQTVWLWRSKHWIFGSEWVGPYKVIVREGVNYTLRFKEGKTLVAYHNQLKAYPVPLDQGLPIQPLAETPGISVHEQGVPLPEVPIQVENAPPGPRPPRLRQVINPPVSTGIFGT